MHQKKNEASLSQLEVSVEKHDDLNSFLHFEKEYLVKVDPEFVWGNYRYSSQTEVWDLNKISFAFLFNKNTESLIYANQDYFGLEKGQIFWLNLKILNGFYNLPVVFEIINIDPEHNLIEFSYIKGGKARGKQSIQFEPTEEGYTRIVHRSYVKSDSKFRDKFLYPYFHNKLINEFHGNMKRMITRLERTSSENLAEIK